MTNSEIDLRKAVTKSETIMCLLIVNLNLPLSTADTFTECFKQTFTDSKIAKGMTYLIEPPRPPSSVDTCNVDIWYVYTVCICHYGTSS